MLFRGMRGGCVMKVLIAATLVIAAFSVSARADGVPASYTNPVYVAPRWAGFYIGGDAGASWNSFHEDYTQAPGSFPAGFAAPFAATGFSRSVDLSENAKFLGGGHIGYNYQVGPWVGGIETDFKWRENGEDGPSSTETFSGFHDVLKLTASESWVGTLRGRVGWAADKWLVFATGGLAYGKVNETVFQGVVNPIPGASTVFSNSSIQTGWTVGGGFEYAFDDWWSVGIQYLHTDLGSANLAVPDHTVGPVHAAAFIANLDDTSDEVTARISARFGN
jgi:outer membrane immunogenic protein